MEGKRSRRDKLVWALAVMNVATLVLILTPVGAHVNNSVNDLWGEHIKPKVRKLTGQVAFANISDAFLEDGTNDVKARTQIKAPRDGGLLVIAGNIDSAIGTGNDELSCAIDVENNEKAEVTFELDDTTNANEDCTITVTEPVDKGNNLVELRIEDLDDTDVSFESANLWALWVPKDGRVPILNP